MDANHKPVVSQTKTIFKQNSHSFFQFSHKHTHTHTHWFLRGYTAVRYQTESALAVWHTCPGNTKQDGVVSKDRLSQIYAVLWKQMEPKCWSKMNIEPRYPTKAPSPAGVALKGLVWVQTPASPEDRAWNLSVGVRVQPKHEIWAELTDAHDSVQLYNDAPSCTLMANNGSTRWEVKLSCQTRTRWGSKITEGTFSISTRDFG